MATAMKPIDWEKVRRYLGYFLGGCVVLGIIGLIVFRAAFLTHVEKHELGYVFNKFNGKIEKLDRTGYFVFNPIKYSVHKIDLRPYQISITASFGANSSGSSGVSARVLNAKLVKFNPEEPGLDTFIAWHGCDAGDSVDNLKEILKCYAFDKDGGTDCPFLTVISELAPAQGGGVPPERSTDGNRK